MVQQVPRRWNISLNLSQFESQLSTPWGFETFRGFKILWKWWKIAKIAKFNTFKVKNAPKNRCRPTVSNETILATRQEFFL